MGAAHPRGGVFVRLGQFIAAAAVVFALTAARSGVSHDSRVVIDDPTETFGDGHVQVADEAALLAGGSILVISVVPSLGENSVQEVITDRYTVVAPGDGKLDPMVLLVLDERQVHFGYRDASGFSEELLASDDIDAAVMAGTNRFESAGPSAAAITTLRTLRSGFAEPDAPREGRRATTWVAWLVWLIPLLFWVWLVAIVKAVRARAFLGRLPTEPTPVRDLAPGTAAVEGHALSSQPLLSPITQTRCLRWEVDVEETLVVTTVETGRGKQMVGYDLNGIPMYETQEVSTSRTSREERRASASDTVPFYIRDGTGDVLVLGAEADVRTVETFNGKLGTKDPRYWIPGIPPHPDGVGPRQVRERVFPADVYATVVGPVEAEGDRLQFCWNRRFSPSSRHLFLVSQGTLADEVYVRRWVSKWAWKGGIVFVVGSAVVLAVVAVWGWA